MHSFVVYCCRLHAIATHTVIVIAAQLLHVHVEFCSGDSKIPTGPIFGHQGGPLQNLNHTSLACSTMDDY